MTTGPGLRIGACSPLILSMSKMENMTGTPLEWGQVFNSIDNVKKQGKEPTVKNVLEDWGSSLKEFGLRIFKP